MASVTLFVFDDFVQVGAVANYTSLEWVRRYNADGEFTLTLPFSTENFELLALWRVLYKRETREGGIITGRKVVRGQDGTDTMTITGRFLSSFLRERTYRFTGTGLIDGIVNNLVADALITSSRTNRRIPGFQIVPYSIPPVTVSLDNAGKEYNLYALVEGLAKQSGLGFAVDFDPERRTFDFRMYQGRETGVVFSEQYNNVMEQDYYESIEGYKNTCIIGNVIVGDDNAGIRRREVSTESNTASGITVAEQGALYLLQHSSILTFDTVVSAESMQFTYLTDWDVGDVVLCRNTRYNISAHKTIVEVTESYDLDALHISVLFGDLIPTVRQLIRG